MPALFRCQADWKGEGGGTANGIGRGEEKVPDMKEAFVKDLVVTGGGGGGRGGGGGERRENLLLTSQLPRTSRMQHFWTFLLLKVEKERSRKESPFISWCRPLQSHYAASPRGTTRMGR